MGRTLSQALRRGADATREFAALREASVPALKTLFAGDPREALHWVRLAAFRGVSAAQIRLGRMLLDGTGAPPDPVAALGWFRTAALNHDTDAMNMIGRCYENGWGIAADFIQAANWYRRAAERGHGWARYNLGHCYLDGIGVFPDSVKALTWYRRAAEGGHSRAMNLVGRCLEEGWGTRRDRKEAAGWYARSAALGYFRGQYNHATILSADGNVPAASEWFRRAAEGGTDAVRRAVVRELTGSAHAELQALGRELACASGQLHRVRADRETSSGCL